MLGAKENGPMTSEWTKLTSQDGEDIHVNLANASTIEVHKKGSRISFLAGVKDGNIDVSEAPEEILEKFRVVRIGRFGNVSINTNRDPSRSAACQKMADCL